MGVWNSHTSVGNILGSLIAAHWVSSNWGLSFIIPGLIIMAMGGVCFLFLIEREFLRIREQTSITSLKNAHHSYSCSCRSQRPADHERSVSRCSERE